MGIQGDHPRLTVTEALIRSLEDAVRYNPNDAVSPCAILWTDQDAQWQPIIPQLRQLLPHLLTLGEYQPDQRTGPAIWLRSAVDRALPDIEWPEEKPPILYLPEVSRQELRAVQECPDNLKPLVELQYRGVCWTQTNGKDWTVEAFLVSEDGGLGLYLARDGITRQAMLGALEELATTAVEDLTGKHLEAEDFNQLFSDDIVRDLLRWLSEPETVKSQWNGGRWTAFKSRCQDDYKFDPDRDGELIGAELLGKREDQWAAVWERFAESPVLYPGIPELLQKAMPSELFVERSSWPQENEKDEEELRQALLALEHSTPAKARELVRQLETQHGPRRDWVWAKLEQAQLARALAHLAILAELTATGFGGASTSEMAARYVDSAWQVDSAALSAMATVKTTTDMQAVSKVLDVIYKPWLESAAEHLQKLAERDPLPGQEAQGLKDVAVELGGVILFADGLRFDVSQQLAKRMRTKGWSVTLRTRWAGLPSVTATAKPAISPISQNVKGLSLGEDFSPTTADSGQPLTTHQFRKLLTAAGYQYLSADETGDPSNRAWTESGNLDKQGHSLQDKLAGHVHDQIELLLERIESLLKAGWDEVRVVTDHGWLWLPGGLPKVDLPRYLTESRWARCAVIKGGSNVEVPTVSWNWNVEERVAVAPSIACFSEGHKYAHGGLSLQECLIPVISVTGGAAPEATAPQIAEVSWVRFRCRVRIEPAQLEWSVDMRTEVNNADSSITSVRTVDAEGSTSLLVEDDDLEGEPAVVVVLDAGGNVLAKQAVIVGGDS